MLSPRPRKRGRGGLREKKKKLDIKDLQKCRERKPDRSLQVGAGPKKKEREGRGNTSRVDGIFYPWGMRLFKGNLVTIGKKGGKTTE